MSKSVIIPTDFKVNHADYFYGVGSTILLNSPTLNILDIYFATSMSKNNKIYFFSNI